MKLQFFANLININIVSINYLDTLLHDENGTDSNVSSQDEYGENERSFSSDENDSALALRQPFQIGNHVNFRSFLEIARCLVSRR